MPCAALGTAQTPEDSLAQREFSPSYVATFTCALFPGAGTHDWIPTLAIRAGYGFYLDKRTTLSAFVEYDHYKLGQSGGLSSYSSLSPKRTDIALYASMAMVQTIEIGFGVAYSASDDVTYNTPDGHSGSWPNAGKAEFRTYLSVGVRYAISITHALSVPVGIYYRALDYGTESSPAVRIGIQWLF